MIYKKVLRTVVYICLVAVLWVLPSNMVEQLHAQSTDALIWAVAWSPDGTLIAAGDSEGYVQIWDGQTHSLLYSFEAREPDWHESVTSSVKVLDWSPDGSVLAAGVNTSYSHGFVLVIDPYAQEILASVEFGEIIHRVSSVAWSPDGSLLAAGGQQQPIALREGWLKVWDATTYELVAERQQGHADMVTAVAWSPDGSRLASAAYDETLLDNNVIVWDTATRERVLTLEHSLPVASVAWRPDGSQLVTGGGQNSGRIWDAATGQLLVEIGDVPIELESALSGARWIAWNPHVSQQMVSLSRDYFVYWDAITGRVTGTYHTWSEPANFAWCPTENCLVYASSGTIQTLSPSSPSNPAFEPLTAYWVRDLDETHGEIRQSWHDIGQMRCSASVWAGLGPPL